MNVIQKNIGEFSKKNFPVSNACSKFNHLVREIDELRNALEHSPAQIKSEIADCMILLYDIAEFMGIDAEQEIIAKMEINKNREWGEPDEFGVVEHIRQ
jgi:NTP pyrophosphatase (non-canonical NTP hydrolase)